MAITNGLKRREAPTNAQHATLPTTPQGKTRDGPGYTEGTPKPSPSDEDIYKYIIRPDAVAKCLVRDCLQMRDGCSDWKFWWLGNIPVRSVELVGTIVGVIEYERRVLFTVDDGTGVLDAVYQLKPKPPPPNLKSAKGKEVADGEYLPWPQVDIGATVRVIGKLEATRYDRRVLLDSIGHCSPNTEPHHWLEVVSLHQTKYNQPFILPSMPSTHLTHPPAEKHSQSICPSSPISVTEASSPVKPSPLSPSKPDTQNNVPAQLRHPSRLSSRHLTPNTFRIYLKHYMDAVITTLTSTIYLKHYMDTVVTTMTSSISLPGTTALGHTQSREDVNPYSPSDDFTTPRKRSNYDPHRTPRRNHSSTVTTVSSSDNILTQGMSLSYLMRVPELRDLGRKVVKAEGKRREKAAKLREKEFAERNLKSTLSSGAGAIKKKLVVTIGSGRIEPTGVKVKRLFAWAIRMLFDEGSIINGDGPGKHWETIGGATEDYNRSRNLCWRDVSNTTISNSTISSLSSGSISYASSRTKESDEDESMLAQEVQDPKEPSYLPISNALLHPFIVQIMSKLLSRGGDHSKGVSPAEILSRLKQEDERWEKLAVFSVEECLNSLQGVDGAVWKVQANKWALVSCV